MAKKTRVSFIRGMMVATATKGSIPRLIQIGEFDAGSSCIGSKISTIKATYPPRTASHKPAKKATTHGYALNTARVRKKKRRDVNTTAAQQKVTTSLSSMMHSEFELGSIAEKRSAVGYEIASENPSSLTYES